MSASGDKGKNNMLDSPWFYEIDLSVVMRQHKVIKLNCWALVVDQNSYSASIWLKNAQKFKYIRNDFSTLYKVVDQFDQKYFHWNDTQNISNGPLAHNLKQLMQCCTNNNDSNPIKSTQKQSEQTEIQQKQSEPRSHSQQELLQQLEIIKTKMENSKHKTNKLNQKTSSLQLQKKSNPNDKKLKLHQQKINENQLIYEKLERKYTEINQIYINKIVEEEGDETHGEPQQNGQILTGILNTISSDTVVHVSKQITGLNLINNKQQIQELVSLILQIAIKNTQFMREYVQLFIHLQREYSDQHQNIIEESVVNSTRSLFINSQENQMKDKHSFLNVMDLVGELYIVGLFRTNLVSKGVLKSLLPPTNKAISEIDMEGICRLLCKCGKLLEEEDKKCCEESIKILAIYAQSFGGAVRDLVDDLNELRNNNWLKSALQEKYSALRHKHKKLQMKYDKLHGKYIAMMKRSDYICWKAKDIVNWITSLNKWKYSKYCKILREKMENEGIDGKCLPDVDKDDLRRLGVTDFKDNCEIYDAINQLINKTNITT